MLKIGDVFIHDRKKYVVVDSRSYTVNTEMHSMHTETILDYHCRRLFDNGNLGRADKVYSSYNHYGLKAIDHVKIRAEYSIAKS